MRQFAASPGNRWVADAVREVGRDPRRESQTSRFEVLAGSGDRRRSSAKAEKSRPVRFGSTSTAAGRNACHLEPAPARGTGQRQLPTATKRGLPDRLLTFPTPYPLASTTVVASHPGDPPMRAAENLPARTEPRVPG